MRERTIEVTIDEEGNVFAETKGIIGPICVEELDSILAGLEGEREVKNTGDYYKESPQTIRRQVRAGRGS